MAVVSLLWPSANHFPFPYPTSSTTLAKKITPFNALMSVLRSFSRGYCYLPPPPTLPSLPSALSPSPPRYTTVLTCWRQTTIINNGVSIYLRGVPHGLKRSKKTRRHPLVGIKMVHTTTYYVRMSRTRAHSA